MATLDRIHSISGRLLKNVRSGQQDPNSSLHLSVQLGQCICLNWQAARDGLAALHGDPKRAALGEEKFEAAEGQEAAKSQKESWQKTVLDSLVSKELCRRALVSEVACMNMQGLVRSHKMAVV